MRGTARRIFSASDFQAACRRILTERLAANQVYVAPRLGRLRVSPHVYNDEADIDRFIEVLRSLIRPRQGREALIA